MNKESRYEKIDQYLSRELEEKELEEFESQLKTDKTLRQDIVLIQDVKEAVEDMYLDTEFAPKLWAMSKDYFKEDNDTNVSKNTNSKKNRQLFLIVGFIIIIGLLSIFLWKNFATVSTEKQPPATTKQIFAAYFEPYAVDNLQRGSSTSIVTYQDAIQAYQMEDYAKVISILEEAQANSPDDSEVKMLLGNSYLKRQSDEAITVFQTMANDETNLYSEEAQWYLSLAYLQNDDLSKAQPLLQALADKKIGKYAKLALEVLARL